MDEHLAKAHEIHDSRVARSGATVRQGALIAFCCVMVMSACGGGSTGPSGPTLPPPSAPNTPPVPTQFVVSGFVHFPAPEQNVAVAGARVEITTGQRAGEQYFTDERGLFTLPPVTEADWSLKLSKDDFNEARYAVNGLTASRAIDVEMMPQRVQREWNGTITGPSDDLNNWTITGWDDPYRFETYRSGDVKLELDCTCHGLDGDVDLVGFWVQSDGDIRPPPSVNLAGAFALNVGVPVPGTGLHHFESKRVTLTPGRYLVASVAWGLGNPYYTWKLRLVRPW